jgi:hypothetical protein
MKQLFVIVLLVLNSLAMAEDVPMPGSASAGSDELSGKKKIEDILSIKGYVENTTNVEYLYVTGRENILNSTRGRVNLLAKPDKHFDIAIGVVGNLYTGNTDLVLTNYLPPTITLTHDVYSPMVLTVPFVNTIYLQEAFGTLYTKYFRLRVGRQKYYTGTGYAFNPTDLFNTKNAMDPTYETDGIDAIFFSFDLPEQVEIHGLVKFSDNFQTTDYLARLKWTIKGWDFAVQYTRYNQKRYDWSAVEADSSNIAAGSSPISLYQKTFIWNFVGAEFSGEIGDFHIYAEGGYAFIEAPSGGTGSITAGDYDHERVLVGFDYTFSFQLYIMVEYLRYGQGRSSADEITLNDRIAFYSGEMIALAKNTLYAGISYPVTEFIDLSLYAMVGIDDASAIIIPWMTFDLFPGMKLSLAVNIPVGTWYSMVGRSGVSGFLRVKYHF